MTNYTAINQNFSSMTSFANLLSHANTSTGGWFWVAINWTVFLIVLLSLMQFGFEVSLLVAGFISLIIGIFLTYMDLSSWTNTLIYFGIILLSIIWIIWGSNRENV